MFQRLRAAKLVLPTFCAVIAFTVLIGLGVWQMQRLAWKEDLIAKIAQRNDRSPIAIEKALQLVANDPTEVQYLPVSVTGRMQHKEEAFVFNHDKKLGPGAHIYTPLKFAPNKVVWLNRGFVAEAYLPREKRGDGLIDGDVTITGLARLKPAVASIFTPQSDLVRRQFYWPDLEGMHGAVFDDERIVSTPFFLEVAADGQPQSAHGPHGGVTRVRLTNKHLGYALTWFGLALTLVGVYLAFAIGRIRGSR